MDNSVERPGLRPSRRVVVVEARLSVGGRSSPAELLDLSLGGARLLCPGGAPVAGEGGLVLGLRIAPGQWLDLPVEPIRSEGDALACRFTGEGEAQREALRALIRERGSLALD